MKYVKATENGGFEFLKMPFIMEDGTQVFTTDDVLIRSMGYVPINEFNFPEPETTIGDENV